MSLRDELNRIRSEYGRLTIDSVLQDADPDTAVLHDHFDWDNEIAGPKWRRHQAHSLIASVRITYREADEENPAADVRAFHAVRGDNNSFHYEPAETIAADPILTEIVLRDMRREWQQMRRRYGRFTEFVDLVRGTLEEEEGGSLMAVARRGMLGRVGACPGYAGRGAERLGAAGEARHVLSRLGVGAYVVSWRGRRGSIRQVVSRPVWSGHRPAAPGAARLVWLGAARLGLVGHHGPSLGMAWPERLVASGPGRAHLGRAAHGGSGQVPAWHGSPGEAGLGCQGRVRQGRIRQGLSRLGQSGPGKSRQVGRVGACPGMVTSARQVAARPVRAWQAGHGASGRVLAVPGAALRVESWLVPARQAWS